MRSTDPSFSLTLFSWSDDGLSTGACALCTVQRANVQHFPLSDTSERSANA